uniref:Putative lipid A core-O-antigen ligase and related enzymes n=1 Tax=Magnetococcus massalia (strain MO-1) TaxID=451514 RepID=A0A1S7LHV0_MAGMO|nr:putative lipid A core-O-antigen ligase and related enzymes [Candidatus Magnetococcus massalia]
MLEKSIFAGACFLLFLVPWPLASNRPWIWFAETIFIFLLIALFQGTTRARSSMNKPLGGRALFALGVLLIWSLFPLLQIIPLPSLLLEKLAPWGFYQRETLFPGLWAPISLDPHATWAWVVQHLSYAGFFALVLVLVRDQQRLYILLGIMFMSGLLQAIYGLWVYFSGSNLILFMDKWSSLDSVSGSFVNRNHFATFILLTLPIGVSFIFKGMYHINEFRFLSSARRVDRFRIYSILVLLGVMLLALVGSNSRGGIVCFVIVAIIMLCFLIIRRGLKTLPVWPILLTGGALGGALFSSMGEELLRRFKQEPGKILDRLYIYQDSWHLFTQQPLTGIGAGSFESTFPAANTYFVSGHYTHVHNDHLEMLLETGVIGYSLFLLFLIWCWLTLWNDFKQHNPIALLGVLFSLMAATFGMMIHSAMDFPMAIPANKLYFFTLLAIGLRAKTLFNPDSS